MFDYMRSMSLRALAGLVALGSIFTACKDNDDQYTSPSYTITPEIAGNTLSIPAEGGTYSFTIETNRRWTATPSAAWLDVSPTSGGAGKQTITVQALPNTFAARRATIALALGATIRSIQVEQAGSSTPAPGTFEGMPLADFIAKYATGSGAVITDDVFFQAVVLTDLASNNTTSLKNITVQAGTSGINIRLNSNGTYAPGALLTFHAKGAKLAYYNGSLQLDYTGLTSGITDTGETRTIEPTVATLEEIYAGKYQSILVAVDNVQFEKPGRALNGLSTTSTQYNTITDTKTSPTDAQMGKLSVAVSTYAKFKGETISDKSGRIVGILGYSATATRKNYNLWVRNMGDIQLTNERITTPVVPPASETTTLADFIKKYDTGSDITVAQDEIFLATLLTDKDANNITGLKNLTVQSGDQGINIRLKASSTFSRNAVLRINANGAKVTRYNGALQIDFTNATADGVVATGESKVIEPKVLTLSQIYERKYESILVAVDNVQFDKPEGVLNGRTSGTQYHTLSDCATEPTGGMNALSVPVSFYAQFKGEQVSNKRGRIVGILAYSITDKAKNCNLWIRDLADLQLSVDRCTAGGGDNGGGTTPTPTAADLIISAYVEGKGNNKYLQIYNPTGAAIDLSAYTLKLENYSGSGAQSKPATFVEYKLSGSLASKGVLVLAHNSATLYTGTATKAGDVMNFNGNDNVALFKGETMIDVVGTWGAVWVNGTKGAGLDKAWRRKAEINKPNATYITSEWDEASIDDVSYLQGR